jgi:RNA polymerase sigma-70 factor, ECF subfamily
MIQLRLDGTRRSRRPAVRPSWRTGAAMVRLTLSMTARPLRHLLQPGTGNRAHRPSAAQPLSGAAAQQSTFERWFARYQLPLLDYLYGMTRDREWAADLVQETFLQAYSAAGQDPTAIAHPQAWLYRIATNAALSALRRKRRFSWLPLSVVEPESGASSSDRWLRPELTAPQEQDLAATVAERDAVWTVLAVLPPRWRAVLLLQTTGGFEVREIAAELGISEANTRKLLFRAKERFRQVYARLAEAEAKGGIR